MRVTTGIRIVDDPRRIRARIVIANLDDRFEREWTDKAAGRDPGGQRRFDDARAVATRIGLTYRPTIELVTGPVEELIRWIHPLESRGAVDKAPTVDAFLGGAEKPVLLLPGLVEAFEAEHATALQTYSPDQIRKWRNPKKRTLANLIAGDKAVTSVTRADALAVRDHWRQRVLAGDVEIGTANKDVGHLSKMLRMIEDAQRIGISAEAFAPLRLEGDETGQRTAYAVDFVQAVI